MKRIILACALFAFALVPVLLAVDGQCPSTQGTCTSTNKVSCPADKGQGCCPKDAAGGKSCPMMKDAAPAKK